MDLTPYVEQGCISTWSKDLIEKYVSNVPLKITELHEGISTCKLCGAKYAGLEKNCINKVPFVKILNTWNGHLEERRFYKNYKEHQDSKFFYYKQCGSMDFYYSEQGAIDEFNRYVDFLNTIDQDLNCSYDVNVQQKYVEGLKPEVLALMSKRLIIKVSRMEVEIQGMKNAINEIASKMDSAGNMLRF